MLIGEGKTRLEVPKDYMKKVHFFNPEMELARDITVLLLNALKTKDWLVCDALAGTGARGIRIANECKVKEVWINDANPKVLKFARKNVEINNLKNVTITNKDANVLLAENKKTFDYIDLDPFGSPSYYFNSTAIAIKKGGLIGLTATDTACLAGTYPFVCLRRYGVKSYKTDFMHELGIRILITSIALALSRWTLTFKPLISYAMHHYYRVWGIVERGRKKANESVRKNLGYINYCPSCLWRNIDKKPKETCEFCNKRLVNIGFVWIGKIEDRETILSCLRKLKRVDWLKKRVEIEKLFHFLKNEGEAQLYYDIHKLCKKHKKPLKKFVEIVKSLRSNGFLAFRTHFCKLGIKTNASLEELMSCI